MTFRFVALDLGNVLCDLFPPAFHRALAQATGKTQQQAHAALPMETWNALEVGDATPAQFRAAVLRQLGATLGDAEFDACWNLIPPARVGADALVARLRAPHVIWSNTDPIHSAHLATTLACLGTAAHLNLSHLTRARKPDPLFYQRGLAAVGAAAQEVLFIDDRPENREGAAALGIVTEAALSLADVEAALRKHALI